MTKLKAFVIILAILSVFSPRALAVSKTYYEKNLDRDRMYILKLDNSGRTGNFVVLESNGKFALLDAGAVNLAESETVIYPALESLKIKEFEFALISHFDEDHFSYLTNGNYGQMRHADKNGNLLEKYKVKKVITRDASQDFAHYSSQDYLRLKKSLTDQGIPVEWKKSFQFGDFNLTVVNNHPTSQDEINLGEEANADSTGVLVEKNGYKVFIGGDMERLDEADMLKSGEIDEIRDADVFVMNHHGLFTTSNSPEFLDALKAKIYVMTNNIDGFTVGKMWGGDEAIRIYSNYVGRENILSNHKGTVEVDFTDTRKGISAFQLAQNYSKTVVREDLNIEKYETKQKTLTNPAVSAESKNNTLILDIFWYGFIALILIALGYALIKIAVKRNTIRK